MKTAKTSKAIKDFLKKHWQKWTILAILGIVIYVGVLFYLYIYKPIYQPRDLVPQKLEINEQIYQEIMDHYNQREQIINEIISKNYQDVFR